MFTSILSYASKPARPSIQRSFRRKGAILVALASALAACKAGNGDLASGGAGGGNTQSNGNGNGTQSGGTFSAGNGGSSGTFAGSGAGQTSGVGGGCAGTSVQAEKIPLDMFIMLDQSGSMDDSVSGGTKWTTVTSALNTFMGQPGLTGVSVGLGYFGVPDSTGFGDSCTASDYAVPDVEISALPAVASRIQTSMAQHSPTTATPTSAALQGAIDHAKTWSSAHPGDATVVILATDGDPSECDTTISGIQAIAAAGFNGTPKIPTYVIGVGSSLANLNAIASSGGSTSAFLVDTGGNVNQQFLQAMNDIRHAALGCSYAVPTSTNGQPVDYNTVNIVYQPGNGGPPITLPYVMTKANCPATGNGWYYDNPSAPTQILLCDSSCSGIELDTTGSVNITLGCSQVIL